MEHVRDSPKVKVFYAISSCEVYGPLFFVGASCYRYQLPGHTATVVMPQLQEDSEHFIFQQDGAPPHFHFDVRAHLSANVPGCWIARASHNDCSSSLASTVT
jgi:hypothetical protein